MAKNTLLGAKTTFFVDDLTLEKHISHLECRSQIWAIAVLEKSQNFRGKQPLESERVFKVNICTEIVIILWFLGFER